MALAEDTHPLRFSELHSYRTYEDSHGNWRKGEAVLLAMRRGEGMASSSLSPAANREVGDREVDAQEVDSETSS